MRQIFLSACAVALLVGVTSASAADDQVKGAVAGAVGGAVVAGPVGAVVGGVGGAVIGHHMDRQHARHWRRHHHHHAAPHS